MFTSIFFLNFVLLSVYFGCVCSCSFSSFEGVVHKNHFNLSQRKRIQVSNILVFFTEILVYLYKGCVFCWSPLLKNQKPLEARLRYITNVFHWNFSKGILKTIIYEFLHQILIVLKFHLKSSFTTYFE